MQPCLRHLGRFLGLSELLLQIEQARIIWCGQGVAVCVESILALSQLARLLFNAALFSGQHLYLLLHLRHITALCVGGILCGA